MLQTIYLTKAIRTTFWPSHFFGSIVASTEGDDYIINDGQQRLTTVSLLLLALMNLIKEGKVAYDSSRLADKIREDGSVIGCKQFVW